MTEKAWLACGTPDAKDQMLAMYKVAESRVSNRKLRLFGCACCRRFAHLLPTEATRHALEWSERAADGLVPFSELAAARAAIKVQHPRNAGGWASNCAHFLAGRAAKSAAFSAYSTANEVARSLGEPDGTRHRPFAALMLDVVGNPFRAPRWEKRWRTSTVRALARAAYDNRPAGDGRLDPLALAVLADALQEADCDEPALLDHLRAPGPHVRGCWVLDVVLGNK
jgi:hypothetical protein